MQNMKWNELDKENCLTARALSVIGDRWTMLIIRDCFSGIRRFDKFQESLGVTRHVLADRLKKLESYDILKKVSYQEKPPRYEYRLTDKGKALQPILLILMDWAKKNFPAKTGPFEEVYSKSTQEPIDPVLVDKTNGEEITLFNVFMKSDEDS